MADPVLGYDDEELVAVVVDERNWKGIGISLLVIATIFSFIGLAIFIVTPKSQEDLGRYRVNLTDILGTHLKGKYFNATWISGHELLFHDRNGSILIYNAAKNTSKTLVSSPKISHLTIHDFKLSSDRRYLLLDVGHREINSSLEVEYQIYNISYSNLVSLRSIISSFTQSKTFLLNYSTWSNHGNAFIFVANNDIYYCPDVESKPFRVTDSGLEGIVYNGIPNWFYREFIGMKKAIWWTKGSPVLMYATFNDSLVDLNAIKIYGSIYESSTAFNVSPAIVTRRYPKAGRNIPEVTLWIANVNDLPNSKRRIKEPELLANKAKYLTYAEWISKDEVTVIWTLRDQNYSVMLYCFSNDQWQCKQSTIISDSITKMKHIDNLIISADQSSKKNFIIIPKYDLKNGVHNHVAFFNPKEKYVNLVGNFITHGPFDVTNLLAYDPDEHIIYFQGTGANGLTHKRHIYSKRLSNETENSECLTCKLGEKCGYYDAVFSMNAEYYLLRCLGPKRITAEIRLTGNHSKVFDIDQNKDFHDALMDKRMPQEMFLSLLIDNDSRRLNIKLLIPPPRRQLEVLRKDEEKNEPILCPLIIESFSMIDGTITEKYDLHWGYYLSSSKEYIYAQLEIQQNDRIEHNNHPSRDFLWTKINYDHQMALVDLLESLPGRRTHTIDRRRIAIWGSSAAGFTALSTLAQDSSNLISCGLAFAPVINWRLMDSISAEYLFGDPQAHEYAPSYELNNLLSKADQLTKKRFLLIHGTADDIVHIQHTMLFTRACIKEATDGNMNYQIQLYPDDDHYLTGSKIHFYRLSENFLQRCFIASALESS